MKRCTDPHIPMNPQEALKVLDTKLNIEGPISIVIDEIRARMTGVAALKKQIPKKIKDEPLRFACPVCNETVCGTDYEYCPKCGQKLDWGDGE